MNISQEIQRTLVMARKGLHISIVEPGVDAAIRRAIYNALVATQLTFTLVDTSKVEEVITALLKDSVLGPETRLFPDRLAVGSAFESTLLADLIGLFNKAKGISAAEHKTPEAEEIKPKDTKAKPVDVPATINDIMDKFFTRLEALLDAKIDQFLALRDTKENEAEKRLINFLLEESI